VTRMNVKDGLSEVVARRRQEGGEFCYVFAGSTYSGKKAVMAALEADTAVLAALREKLADDEETEAQFGARILKAIPLVRFEDVKTPKSNGVETTNKSKISDGDVKEAGAEPPEPKEYPVTLDYMKTIDSRTTKIPNYGSLAGRIARLLAMLVKKESEDNEETDEDAEKGVKTEKWCIVDRKSGIKLACAQLYEHLEKDHGDFLQHLYSMFPPAKKRMDQFILRAVENFDLEVPTWAMVQQLQKDEANRLAWQKKKELEEKQEILKKARQELEEKRKKEKAEVEAKRKKAAEEMAEKRKIEADKKAKETAVRMALKRKQEEEIKLKEFKMMKINPKFDKAEELLKVKKEIARIENALAGKSMTEKNKDTLRPKLVDQKNKLHVLLVESKEKNISARMEDSLENLSPKQLRKLIMEYLGSLDSLDQVSWSDLCQTAKIEDDFEFLFDFLGNLYDMSKFYGKKGFKVGHILVTSKQSEAILEKGVRSVRDSFKSDTWRIPSHWEFDPPTEDLGGDWNRKDDSRLLIGASRFGKNMQRIIQCFPKKTGKVVDSEGKILSPVKKRFGYLLNVYMNRGAPVAEIGDSLYSVDVVWDEFEEEDEEVEVLQETKAKTDESKVVDISKPSTDELLMDIDKDISQMIEERESVQNKQVKRVSAGGGSGTPATPTRRSRRLSGLQEEEVTTPSATPTRRTSRRGAAKQPAEPEAALAGIAETAEVAEVSEKELEEVLLDDDDAAMTGDNVVEGGSLLDE